MRETVKQVKKGKHRKKSPSSPPNDDKNTTRAADGTEAESSSKSRQKDSGETKASEVSKSQLVDLVVEDTVAEETERVRARKEGSSAWNQTEPRRYV